jgi:hypothetical protein
MPEEKNRSTEAGDPQESWTFAGSRSRVLRMGLEMTPAERLRWLEETVEEMLPWVGRARLGRPVEPSDG